MSSDPGPSSHASHDQDLRAPVSSRHRRSFPRVQLTTNIQPDAVRDAFDDTRHLLELFYEFAIPGPLLVRTETELSQHVGRGGQGQVRAASSEYLSALQSLDATSSFNASVRTHNTAQPECISFWQTCVVKKLRGENGNLQAKIQSAVREVYSLCQASKSVQARQYVVRLLGWGLCLDALESNDTARSVLPFLVLERAMCDIGQFVIDGKHEAISISIRIRMAMDIGLGIQALHASKMTHGDLKPSNVLIFQSGHDDWQVKICDFGSASSELLDSPRGRYIGTDTWRPPEIYTTSGVVDLQACDIFAYGLVTWAWLIGRDASPIANLDRSQILVDRGQQQFYHRALFDIVTHFGHPSDHAWLQNRGIFCSHSRDIETGLPQPKRSPWFCGFCYSLELKKGPNGLTRDFESPIINPIMSTLGVALDELPSRRKRQPWDFLKSGVLAKAPKPPKPTSRYLADHVTEGNVDVSVPSKGYSIVRWLKRRAISARSVSKISLKWDLLPLKHFAFLTAHGTSLNTLRQFHRIFDGIPGWNSNSIDCIRHNGHEECTQLSQRDINALRSLISRSCRGKFVTGRLLSNRPAFGQQTLLPVGECSEDAVYALSRIKSRFKDNVCWDALFARDPQLADLINDTLLVARQSSCKRTLAWAFRHTSAHDVPEEKHVEYFTFLDNPTISDEDRTFRMHVLLERGFFLGHMMHDSHVTAFRRYLDTLKDPKCAIQICQHFQRIASLDRTRSFARFYYTGTADRRESRRGAVYPTTCLHDAVRACNHFVTEFLLKTNFDASARDQVNETASDVIGRVRKRLVSMSRLAPGYHQRFTEINLLSSKFNALELRDDDLPLGWEVWPAGSSQAFVETSTDLEMNTQLPNTTDLACLYPITFKKPSTGLYQAKAIALLEEMEPYLFQLRCQRDTDQEPAKTPHFDESWYQAEAMAQTRLPDDAQYLQEFWVNVFLNLKRRVNRTMAQLGEWSSVKSLTRFLLSGNLIILVATPLSLAARYGGWSVQTQLCLSVFDLTGIYAHLWHILDCTSIFPPNAFIRPWLRVGDAKLDQFYNGGTLLLDFLLALLLTYRTRFDTAYAFVVGSILLQNLLVLGLATILAGRFSFRIDLDSHAGRAARNFTAFPFFATTISYALKSTVSTHNLSSANPPLFMSRVAAVVGILLSAALHLYRQPERLPVVRSDGKHVTAGSVEHHGHLLGPTRLSFSRTHQSPRQSAASLAIIILLCVVMGDNVAVSISHLSNSHPTAPISLSPAFTTLVLVPVISKFLIIIKLIALGYFNQIQTVITRTVCLSLDHGLVVLPLLVLTSWCVGGHGDNVLPAGLVVFLFVAWRLLCLTVYRNIADWYWFKVLPLIATYVVFVFYALVVEPLE